MKETEYSSLSENPDYSAMSIDLVRPKVTDQLDATLADFFENSKDYKQRDPNLSSTVMERLYTILVTKENWTEDKYTYYSSKDPDYVPITVIPTSKPDDFFNHVDMVATIRNSSTMRKEGEEFVEFGIDTTYNIETKVLREKFSYIHKAGLEERAKRENESDFGYISEEKHENGVEKVLIPHQSRDYKGLKMPGFASIKYYDNLLEDEYGNEKREKGMIEIMPRFIVGCSKSLVDIAYGEKWKAGLTELSELENRLKLIEDINTTVANKDRIYCRKRRIELRKKLPELIIEHRENASEIARQAMRACMIYEINDQIKFLLKFMDVINGKRINDKTKDEAQLEREDVSAEEELTKTMMTPQQFWFYDNGKKKLNSLKDYFERAKNFIEGFAETCEPLKIGIDIAKNDPVYLAISNQAKKTYLEGDYDAKKTRGDELYEKIHEKIKNYQQEKSLESE